MHELAIAQQSVQDLNEQLNQAKVSISVMVMFAVVLDSIEGDVGDKNRLSYRPRAGAFRETL